MMGCTDDDTFREGREVRANRPTTRIDDAAELSRDHVSLLIHEARGVGVDLEHSTAVTVCIMGTSKNNSLADKAGVSGPFVSWRQRMNGGLRGNVAPRQGPGRFQRGHPARRCAL